MQFAVILSLVATVSAGILTRQDLPACPTNAGSACGIVTALGKTITYPDCNCTPTCSGDVNFSGITANVVRTYPLDVVWALLTCTENRRKFRNRSLLLTKSIQC